MGSRAPRTAGVGFWTPGWHHSPVLTSAQAGTSAQGESGLVATAKPPLPAALGMEVGDLSEAKSKGLKPSSPLAMQATPPCPSRGFKI